MFRNIFFKKFILPGLIFQSLVIGGGYGTGRELVEFFFCWVQKVDYTG